MRILSWVQNKIHGRHEKKRFGLGASSARHTFHQEARNEDCSGLPEALLSIGTLGKRELEKSKSDDISDGLRSSQVSTAVRVEEVKKTQEELTMLLRRKSDSSAQGVLVTAEEGRAAKQPLSRFLSCPSSSEIDRSSCREFLGYGDLSPDAKIILSKANELLASNNNSTIKPRSFTVLLKGVFGGFAPSPSLRGPMSESKIEKDLWTILHKKIHPRNSASKKKYLDDRSVEKMHGGAREKGEDGGCKWVKTDSEYIVLEI